MHAHIPPSIFHGLAAVFLLLAGSHPFDHYQREHPPSFSTACKPDFGRSPKFIRGEVAAAMREAW